jgi:heterodisulfide reductase subunit A
MRLLLLESDQMPKIGLYLCKCGPNIADAIDLESIAQEIKKDNTVAGIETHNLLCSKDGKEFLAESLKANEFDRIVIAACSPKQHEATFMEVLSSIGLNPYMMQLVNIREQGAWVTPDKDNATGKALAGIRAAISRVKYHDKLEKKEIECNPAVIIIGGGIAGMETALRTAQRDRRVYLIEESNLGGIAKKMRILLPSMRPAADMLKEKIDAVKNNEQIEVIENCTIEEILGFFGNFVARIRNQDNSERELKAGAVVIALDGQHYIPGKSGNFGYGEIDDVLTAAEFEALDQEKIVTKAGSEPRSIALIHCVGRKELGYCSKMCCTNTMKIARDIVQRRPGTKVIECYKNLCLPDKSYDLFFKETKEKGIEFVRFQNIKIEKEDDHISVKMNTTGNDQKNISVDMVILSTGMTPPAKTEEFARIFNIPLDAYGFLQSEHNILEPVSTVTEGVYITAGVFGPGDINDAIAQAGAAAGKILSSLVPGKRLELEVKTSNVSEAICVGCGACVDICAYGAVKLDVNKHISVVNEVLCRGCGNCASVCPSGAASHRHFKTRQIAQEIVQILK